MPDDSLLKTNKNLEKVVQKTRRLIIPSLFLDNFVLWIPNLITGLLMIEISETFDIVIGIAGQLQSISALVSVILCLVIGSLSVKYSYKSLLLLGLVFLVVTSLGSSAAPTFVILLVAFSLYGVCNATILPMSQALIGQYFSIDQRPKMTSYLLAGMAASFVVSSPIVGYIGDWRLSFAIYVVPLALVSIALTIIGLPPILRRGAANQSFFAGFRQIVATRSAIACIAANTLSTIAYMAVNTYFAPLLRQKFSVETSVLSILITFLALIYITGALTAGRLVNRYGRKPLTVLNALLYGIFIIVFFNMSNLVLTLIFGYLVVFCASLRYSAFTSLALEQIPEYRGSMMSLSSLSTYLAQAIGGMLGGLILVTASYEQLGYLGFFAILSAGIFYVFTIDPTQTAN